MWLPSFVTFSLIRTNFFSNVFAWPDITTSLELVQKVMDLVVTTKWCPYLGLQSNDVYCTVCATLPLCLHSLFLTPQCSRSCNTGYRVREVRCLADNISPSDRCDPTLTPESREECNKHPCVAEISESVSQCCTTLLCPLSVQLGQSVHEGQRGPVWSEISLWCCQCYHEDVHMEEELSGWKKTWRYKMV